MGKNRVVVFDLDGTLVDAFADITAAVNVPLGRRSMRTYTVAEIRGMVGDGAGRLVERAIPPGLAPEERRAIFEEMMVHYRAHPADQAHVYPGVFDLLEALLDWGVKLAILSNKPHPMTLQTCEDLGLTKYFEDILGEDPVKSPRKPDPAGLRGQLARLDAGTAILVGDGVPDGQVAAAAGIAFVGCLWGTRSEEELARLGPNGIAREVEELQPMLLRALEKMPVG